MRPVSFRRKSCLGALSALMAVIVAGCTTKGPRSEIEFDWAAAYAPPPSAGVIGVGTVGDNPIVAMVFSGKGLRRHYDDVDGHLVVEGYFKDTAATPATLGVLGQAKVRGFASDAELSPGARLFEFADDKWAPPSGHEGKTVVAARVSFWIWAEPENLPAGVGYMCEPAIGSVWLPVPSPIVAAISRDVVGGAVQFVVWIEPWSANLHEMVTAEPEKRARLIVTWYRSDGSKIGTEQSYDLTPPSEADHRIRIGVVPPTGAASAHAAVVIWCRSKAAPEVVPDFPISGSQMITW